MVIKLLFCSIETFFTVSFTSIIFQPLINYHNQLTDESSQSINQGS